MHHPYFVALDIRDIDGQFNKLTRRTRVINIYDNRVGQGCTWVGHTPQNRRALENILWDRVNRGRVLLLGDINAHSPLWNPHCQRIINAKSLDELIEKFHLLINNESGRATRPASRGVSIIDLTLSTIELGPLSLWEIPQDYPSLSDHELIVLRWKDIGYHLSRSEDGTPARSDIAGLFSAPDKLESAQKDWTSHSHTRTILDTTSSIKNLDDEVDWFEKTLLLVLDAHAKVLRVTSFSKQ